MIHPSTMAGPNWFTGSFGTTNPYQQNTTPFSRGNPFQGPQGGFGFGTTPFQNIGFGFGTTPFQNTGFGFGTNPNQIQNAINEIVRQTVPTIVASYGFQPTNGFQIPTGNWTFGNPFQNTPGFDWQTQNFLSEIIRQTTNQALQNLPQFVSTGGFPGTTWGNNPNLGFNPQQQNTWNLVGQLCAQACQQVCQTTCQAIVACCVTCLNQQNTSFNLWNPTTTAQQQNVWNVVGQICQQACQQLCQTTCQAIVTCCNVSLNTQNTSYNVNTPGIPFTFNTPNTPFNFTNNAPQYSFTPGIPTGAGAF